MPLTREEKEEQIEIMAEAMRRSNVTPTQQEQFDRGYRAPKLPEQFVECISPTGATFTAVIVASKTFPTGRVVNLADYRYPANEVLRMVKLACVDGPDTWDFPSGMSVYNPASGKLTNVAKQYLAEQTYIRDLREYVGKPLDVSIRSDKQKELQKLRAAQEAEQAAFLAKARATESATAKP